MEYTYVVPGSPIYVVDGLVTVQFAALPLVFFKARHVIIIFLDAV